MTLADTMITNKMKIGIDIDNVIADTFRDLMTRFNKEFTKEVKYEEIHDFYYLVKFAGVEKNQADLFINETIHTEEFHKNLKPFQEAIDVIRAWSKRGYNIHYITVRPESSRNLTQNWLERFGFWVPKATLDMLDPGKYNDDSVFKSTIVKRKKIDIMIEDSREIAEALNIPVYLFNRPWNKGKMPENVKRVDSWQEISKNLKNYE